MRFFHRRESSQLLVAGALVVLIVLGVVVAAVARHGGSKGATVAAVAALPDATTRAVVRVDLDFLEGHWFGTERLPGFAAPLDEFRQLVDRTGGLADWEEQVVANLAGDLVIGLVDTGDGGVAPLFVARAADRETVTDFLRSLGTPTSGDDLRVTTVSLPESETGISSFSFAPLEDGLIALSTSTSIVRESFNGATHLALESTLLGVPSFFSAPAALYLADGAAATLFADDTAPRSLLDPFIGEDGTEAFVTAEPFTGGVSYRTLVAPSRSSLFDWLNFDAAPTRPALVPDQFSVAWLDVTPQTIGQLVADESALENVLGSDAVRSLVAELETVFRVSVEQDFGSVFSSPVSLYLGATDGSAPAWRLVGAVPPRERENAANNLEALVRRVVGVLDPLEVPKTLSDGSTVTELVPDTAALTPQSLALEAGSDDRAFRVVSPRRKFTVDYGWVGASLFVGSGFSDPVVAPDTDDGTTALVDRLTRCSRPEGTETLVVNALSEEAPSLPQPPFVLFGHERASGSTLTLCLEGG